MPKRGEFGNYAVTNRYGFDAQRIVCAKLDECLTAKEPYDEEN